MLFPVILKYISGYEYIYNRKQIKTLKAYN